MANTKPKKSEKEILKITRSDQYKTVTELLKKGESNSVYYTLLILSIFIVAVGLLLGNAPVVIGGMLVTPLLTPILVIALGIATGETGAIKYYGFLVLKSVLIVIAISFVLAIFFGQPIAQAYIFDDTMTTGVLYFIVALVSGIAATFAWVRKEANEILPGVAIAVSLLPPLSLLGISLAVFDVDFMRFSFLVFLSNFIGIVLGSMVVFSLLKFYKTDKTIEKEVESSTSNSSS
jgi:uncharacterized hydrophobic protein (TIGR00271 family)